MDSAEGEEGGVEEGGEGGGEAEGGEEAFGLKEKGRPPTPPAE